MKKYIVIVILLIAVGIALGFFTFKESHRLEENMNYQVLDSIQNMKVLDYELDVLLLKSRYGLEKNYDNIARISINLKTEFDNLKNTVLTEEIENNKLLKQKFINYDEQLVIKQDLIENFKTNNAVLINSSNYLLVLGGLVFDIASLMKDTNAKKHVANTNLAAYKFLMTEDVESKEYLQKSFIDLKKYDVHLEDYENGLLAQYILHLRTILERREETQNYLLEALEQPIGKTLYELETTYISSHVVILENADKLRKALIIYSAVLLATLLFFLKILQRHYTNLERESKLLRDHFMKAEG